MRNRDFFLIDALLLTGLPFLVLLLHAESLTLSQALMGTALAYTAISLALRLTIAYFAGLYRCLWQHASVAELERMLAAGVIAGLGAVAVGTIGMKVLGLAPMPLGALMLDSIGALGVFCVSRMGIRLAAARHRHLNSGRRALVVGAGTGGQMILRETQLHQKLRVHVVGFVDDDRSKQNQLLGNVPVVGTLDDLPTLIQQLSVAELIIAMPSARGTLVRKVLKAATDAGIQARTMPGLHDLLSGRVRVSALRSIEIQDLLRREPVVTDLNAVRALATGKTVMVTGAGGSIGSELCRQIAALEPSTLVLVDHSENQVFEIEGELRRAFPELKIAAVIADIRNAARVNSVMAALKPYAIFHAAAHKHVPLMECNIVEAITNNVMGTQNVVNAALDADVQHFVNISTDKAVRPTSIMGTTKRIAERIVLNAAVNHDKNFVSVRFGNVLGSRGSVIPTFMRQIMDGGPVTVTHPEMRRYFMTIPEAVQLVLQAGALGSGGELFVLDMGEPVKIVDLARDLLRLSGLEEGVDMDIAFTGVRPGEKLYEEVLFGEEDIRATNHPKVLRTIDSPEDERFMDGVATLIRNAVMSRGNIAGNGGGRHCRGAIILRALIVILNNRGAHLRRRNTKNLTDHPVRTAPVT
ncbi:polysaccharide biosynthesis protein, partial [bacterium]|nr:polysaccharide biosynthesis protein [bacterium]